jgi:glycosyltransferase involved in cell wall biosynthesis
MKISIVTVCFNAATTIEDTIRSVLSQRYSDLEYIIVDGGSNDLTVELIKKYPKITKFISEPDRGIFDAMNKGLKMASGDVVAFLNSDDFYIDNNVLNQVRVTFSNPQIDACFADLIYVDQASASKVIRYWKSSNYTSGAFQRGWVPAHPTFFCKRSIFNKLGDFDSNYGNAADFELLFRFIELNKINTTYIPSPLVKMRVGGASNNSIKEIFKQNIKIVSILKSRFPNMSVAKFICVKFFSRAQQFFNKI